MRPIGSMAAIVVAACAALSFDATGADAPLFSNGDRFDERGGEALYRAICQGCHMADGRGAVGAGRYPSLAGDPRLASGVYAASVVLNGRRAMPSFAGTLTDAQVADVVDHVRTHFGNEYADPIDAARVHDLRPAR